MLWALDFSWNVMLSALWLGQPTTSGTDCWSNAGIPSPSSFSFFKWHYMDRVIWSERPDHFWRQITKTVSSRPFFSNSQSIISWTDLRISVPMTFMRSPALRRFFYIKKKTFLDHFFQISGTDLRISVPMTFMRSPVLRRFFYIKKQKSFLDHFFPNSRSIISGTDLRISDPMTFMRSPALRRFFYIKKKSCLDHFFSNSRSIISGTDQRISVPMTFMRSPDLRRFFYKKKKKYLLDHFFKIRGPLSQERTWGFRLAIGQSAT